jgi:hypothetical protein
MVSGLSQIDFFEIFGKTVDDNYMCSKEFYRLLTPQSQNKKKRARAESPMEPIKEGDAASPKSPKKILFEEVDVETQETKTQEETDAETSPLLKKSRREPPLTQVSEGEKEANDDDDDDDASMEDERRRRKQGTTQHQRIFGSVGPCQEKGHRRIALDCSHHLRWQH